MIADDGVAGFDGFLRKPVTGELLAQALAVLLRTEDAVLRPD